MLIVEEVSSSSVDSHLGLTNVMVGDMVTHRHAMTKLRTAKPLE